MSVRSVSQSTAADIMTVTIARRVRDREIVFVGHSSPLPLAAVFLAKRLYAPHVTVINLSGGVDPRPRYLPVATMSSELFRGSASLFTLPEFYDLVARRRVDLAFFSAPQIDARARLNNSMLGSPDHPKVKFIGGGGAGFAMSLARRVVVWRTRHDRRTFVEACDFVTAAGNVDRVYTPLCVFRPGRDGLLEVESIHPFTSLDEIQERTGFPLRVPSDGVETTPAPTADELRALSELDPHESRVANFA